MNSLPPGTRRTAFCIALSLTGLAAFLPWQSALGAAFQIPNQSLKAIGSAGANIASSAGPDAAYYNPANLAFLDDRWALETSLTSLWLPEVRYRDRRSQALDSASDFELFYLPQLHLASQDYNHFRFGFSLTYPYGLAKSWDQPFARATAEQFSLFVAEASPSVAYQFTDELSFAAGLRFIYSEGEVTNTISNPPFGEIAPLSSMTREMDADDFRIGYNLALSYQPTPAWRFAATYRSKVTLDLTGNADLLALWGETPVAGYSGPADLELALPAVFSLAGAWTWDDVTIEVAWNRTFWSAIKTLDFNYGNSFTTPPLAIFDAPVRKQWKDSNAFRLGLSYRLNQQLTATLGIALEQTPIPEETVNFDLPDSDAIMYGLGVLYRASDRFELGLAYMYYHTTSRSVTSSVTNLDGTFDEGGAHAITVGVISRF